MMLPLLQHQAGLPIHFLPHFLSILEASQVKKLSNEKSLSGSMHMV